MMDPIQVELGLDRMSSVCAQAARTGRQPALLAPSLLLHNAVSWASSSSFCSCLSSAGGQDSGGGEWEVLRDGEGEISEMLRYR